MKSYDKLKTKLAELFQLNQADLDFGIYRIMNARRDEINQFLENDLLPQVHEAFKQYNSADKTVLKKELENAEKGARALGIEPEGVPKVKELRATYETSSVDIASLENDVYDHLCSFFSRYYDEGDFISLRRYKEGVYAIPYEGEEVKLHWANHDQYYIKTTEYFRDYAFKTPSGHRVHFKIAEADTEKDNIKAANGNDRRFLLHGDKPVIEENGELVIRFEYRPDGYKRKQDAINADIAKRVIADLNDAKLAAWKDRLAVMWKRAGGKETDKTILDKHLFGYTRRNTFDYFIHKDLNGFLRRELDFYVKNEVMRLDDIEEESVQRVEQYLSKIKVIRRIAHKIIDFLAQIENFQKKLWLKKKFVVETNYCVTLDRVPEELYPEIAANDAQREEWVRLFAIDEVEGDLHAPAYTEPMTVDFLKANDKLILDTAFFPVDFNCRLLSAIEDIDTHTGGLLVHSDNFHGLNFIQWRYASEVKCLYADPPFNSPSTEIMYKNDYKHSSFLSLMDSRLALSKSLLCPDGSCVIAIDENEGNGLLRLVMEHYRGYDIVNIPIEHNRKGVQGDHFSYTNEFAIFAVSPLLKNLNRTVLPEDEWDYSNLRNWGGESRREDGANCFYPVFVKDRKIVGFGEVCPDYIHPDSANVPLEDGRLAIYPIDAEGMERKWRYARHTVEGIQKLLKVEEARSGDLQIKKAKADEQFKTVWYGPRYNAGDYGTKVLTKMGFEKGTFTFPKSVNTVRDCIFAVSDKGSIVVDPFAGSGTTGHAIIELNGEDGGSRRFVLIEMGDHFDTVLKPRIQKVVYSKDWKDGKPVSREGVSHMFKYIRLESYEDALANIELQSTGPQQLLLDKAGDFRESYMLKYMLDVESRGSQTLLNIDNFDDPWNYKLLVGAGSVGETKPVNVDLVETFNWLLGLKVKHIDRISGFQVVEGENPKGENVLVIWRKIRNLDETDIEKIAADREKANRDLEEFFRKQQYNTLDSEFDVIYVNGDNNLMNVPLDPDKEGVEPRYKVRLIEEEFKWRMFDVKEI